MRTAPCSAVLRGTPELPCHVGGAGRCPRLPRHDARGTSYFLCVPIRVETYAPLPHDCGKGTITIDEASSMPLQRSLGISIVHVRVSIIASATVEYSTVV